MPELLKVKGVKRSICMKEEIYLFFILLLSTGFQRQVIVNVLHLTMNSF